MEPTVQLAELALERGAVDIAFGPVDAVVVWHAAELACAATVAVP